MERKNKRSKFTWYWPEDLRNACSPREPHRPKVSVIGWIGHVGIENNHRAIYAAGRPVLVSLKMNYQLRYYQAHSIPFRVKQISLNNSRRSPKHSTLDKDYGAVARNGAILVRVVEVVDQISGVKLKAQHLFRSDKNAHLPSIGQERD
mgnify:CR=1 FL=1